MNKSLHDGIQRELLLLDHDPVCSGNHGSGKKIDAIGPSCREEKHLQVQRQHLLDLHDLRPHRVAFVKHHVGLVHHEHPYISPIQHELSHEVLHLPWRSNDDLSINSRWPPYARHSKEEVQVHELPEFGDDVVVLRGELTCRADAKALGPSLSLVDAHQHREGEGRRLSRAIPSLTYDVAALQRDGKGPLLYLRWFHKAHFKDTVQDLRRKIQLVP
mmetsp:Transcript_23467/g.61699  ORF Transcript_23467/g.61699 Transcript_23467/m.61699 type:complete len:216 (+) Transcript_23467:658-1305(+)